MTDRRFDWTEMDDRAVDTVRVLAMDSVQKAGNGHPGTAMSLAPAAYLLFQKYMRHDPADPKWIGRDRFVLSCGHSSLTLYIQLFFSGYGLELADLESFRTWGSRTPGHPEYGLTVGVETTTGPLGQGLATAVGMAMGARYERGLFDANAAPGTSPFDHRVWVLCGDGDLEEGITSEACSLAGTQRLGNLIVIWDDNHISIEDDTAIAFTENVLERYRAYGWHTESVDMCPDGRLDAAGLARALDAAKAETDRPSFIRVRTIIGWPAPHLRNTYKAHGSALGEAEVAATKELLGWDPNRSFEIPDGVLEHVREVKARGAAAHAAWNERLAAWRTSHPEKSALLDRILAGDLPEIELPTFEPGTGIATRKSSSTVIQAIAAVLPEFVGGSADLAESNLTTIEGAPSFLPADIRVKADSPFAGHNSPYGRVLHFGIREHAMGAIVNGMSLSGLLRPFGGTFFVFSDYMRGAVRLSALMEAPATFVWTHDSIGLGEDGPTHQPVEHLWSLRAMPNLAIVRPADATETAVAWICVLRRRGPAGLVLTRQEVPTLDRSELASADRVDRGGYVLAEADGGHPDVLLLATGSEVHVALRARAILQSEGIPTGVVSMPCLEWFDQQDAEYRESVLPVDVKARVSIEAGATQGWWKYIGDHGRTIGLDHFGASADAKILFQEFGITAEAAVAAAKASLASLSEASAE